MDVTKKEPRRLGLFNKRMFFFFGPPHVGDTSAPRPEFDRDPLCPRCGARESQHTIFRDDKKSFSQCPE